MMFCAAWGRYRTELRADLQRFFHLDIDRVGADFSIWQAAACVACLPMGSSLLQAIDPKLQYTTTDFLLHRIGDLLAREHIPFPWEKGEQAIADFRVMDKDAFDAWRSGNTWREIDG